MISAYRWAARRAITIFHWLVRAKSQESVHKAAKAGNRTDWQPLEYIRSVSAAANIPQCIGCCQSKAIYVKIRCIKPVSMTPSQPLFWLPLLWTFLWWQLFHGQRFHGNSAPLLVTNSISVACLADHTLTFAGTALRMFTIFMVH